MAAALKLHYFSYAYSVSRGRKSLASHVHSRAIHYKSWHLKLGLDRLNTAEIKLVVNMAEYCYFFVALGAMMACLADVESVLYTKQWAVQIVKGGATAADKIAFDYGFQNLGKVLTFILCLQKVLWFF